MRPEYKPLLLIEFIILFSTTYTQMDIQAKSRKSDFESCGLSLSVCFSLPKHFLRMVCVFCWSSCSDAFSVLYQRPCDRKDVDVCREMCVKDKDFALVVY